LFLSTEQSRSRTNAKDFAVPNSQEEMTMLRSNITRHRRRWPASRWVWWLDAWLRPALRVPGRFLFRVSRGGSFFHTIAVWVSSTTAAGPWRRSRSAMRSARERVKSCSRTSARWPMIWPRTHKSDLLNVRFSPQETFGRREVELSQWATSRHESAAKSVLQAGVFGLPYCSPSSVMNARRLICPSRG